MICQQPFKVNHPGFQHAGFNTEQLVTATGQHEAHVTEIFPTLNFILTFVDNLAQPFI